IVTHVTARRRAVCSVHCLKLPSIGEKVAAVKTFEMIKICRSANESITLDLVNRVESLNSTWNPNDTGVARTIGQIAQLTIDGYLTLYLRRRQVK
ncbi:hypothetical protein KIN20_006463, partial [Parelaphostrongylus tenuis]